MTEVRIESIAAGGDGVGRLEDGRAVFVPRTAPGDRVELTDLRLHRRFARARLARVLEPSPWRVQPSCPHYDADECGGCQLQHLGYPAQLEAKRRIVGDALRRLARLDRSDPDLVPSEVEWGYRSRLTLAVAAGGRRIGMHRFDRPGEIFDLDECRIAAPALMVLWRAVSRHRARLPDGATQLTLRLDRSGGLHLQLKVREARVWQDAPGLHALLAAEGIEASIWWQPEGGAPRVVAGAPGAYPAVVFEQVHPGLGDRIRSFAVARLLAGSGRHAWDLYAGIGETTALLLERGASVESVEIDRRSVEAAERRGGDRSAVQRHAGAVEEVVHRLRPPDLVITNPPRAGMDEVITRTLLERQPGRIVYVSCDPATLARDLARLAPGYRVGEVTAFDLFPQTAHVETVTVLEIP